MNPVMLEWAAKAEGDFVNHFALGFGINQWE
jgi:hypothetical protein